MRAESEYPVMLPERADAPNAWIMHDIDETTSEHDVLPARGAPAKVVVAKHDPGDKENCRDSAQPPAEAMNRVKLTQSCWFLQQVCNKTDPPGGHEARYHASKWRDEQQCDQDGVPINSQLDSTTSSPVNLIQKQSSQ